jgi:hypothetical protein
MTTHVLINATSIGFVVLREETRIPARDRRKPPVSATTTAHRPARRASATNARRIEAAGSLAIADVRIAEDSRARIDASLRRRDPLEAGRSLSAS